MKYVHILLENTLTSFLALHAQVNETDTNAGAATRLKHRDVIAQTPVSVGGADATNSSPSPILLIRLNI